MTSEKDAFISLVMHPFSFHPIYQNRVWGGDALKARFHRDVPPSTEPYGESWELVDREEAQSVAQSGPYKGKTLNELWKNHREEVFGTDLPDTERFPLLFKILDCQQDLSIQVHPPEAQAETLGGEAKSELWYIVDAAPGATLYVGLKEEMTKEQFREAIESGKVADKVHAIQPKSGESIFLDSGRLHSIGAGFLIYEIQQNSDTTYRVFDWNRLGLDGIPRKLHIEESLACIDFSDVAPTMDNVRGNLIRDTDHFQVKKETLKKGEEFTFDNPYFLALSIITGSLKTVEESSFTAGDTVFIPVRSSRVVATEDVAFLTSTFSERYLENTSL